MFDYYMPGYDYQSATDEEFARKFKHLEYIRGQEAQKSVELAKIGMMANAIGKRRRR